MVSGVTHKDRLEAWFRTNRYLRGQWLYAMICIFKVVHTVGLYPTPYPKTRGLAVAIDGKLAGGCAGSGPDERVLRRALA